MTSVLMMASGAAWETAAFGGLTAASGVVVLKRCVDVDDLLATASSGQADVAVVGLEAPGLDPAAVDRLRRHSVRPVAVVSTALDDPDTRARAERLGISALVALDDLASLPEAVSAVEDLADTRVRGGDVAPPTGQHVRTPGDHAAGAPADGRVVVVWGPGGAPGRTTVAVSLAAELARRGQRTVLVDADPYGGGVGAQLGILDEVSGLLSAARLAAAGQLAERFPTTLRAVDDRLHVLTGLPRADRWLEVRASHLEAVLEQAAGAGAVVVDTGFSLEEDPTGDFGARPARNAMTLTALALADEIVVVGSADPPGLARLARGLVDLREVTGGVPVRVVVNRMRSTLGWSEREIAGMVEGFARVSGLHFLPEDRAGADRALVAGATLLAGGESSLTRGLAATVDALFPASVQETAPRRRGVRARR